MMVATETIVPVTRRFWRRRPARQPLVGGADGKGGRGEGAVEVGAVVYLVEVVATATAAAG